MTPAPWRVWTVPNALTFLRILLIPAFALLWWRDRLAWALIVFAVAAVTDFLDGLLARLLNQRSRLGQILDPAADKLLVLASFATAAARGDLPVWLAALVIGRDVMIALGGAFLRFVVHVRRAPHRWKPTRIGKYTTTAEVLTVALSMAQNVTGAPGLRPWVASLAVACALFTCASAVQYLAYGLQALVAPRPGDVPSDTPPRAGATLGA